MGQQEPSCETVGDTSDLDATSESEPSSSLEESAPSIFVQMQRSLRVLVAKLVAIDHKPHEQQNKLVGISCLALATPSIPAYLAGDWPTALLSLGMTVVSLNADYLYLGTMWMVIDRWCALGYTVYMSWLTFPHLPLLTTLNVLPVMFFLGYSRSSTTKEQWYFRHSLWHFFLGVDVPLFLVFGTYYHEFFGDGNV
mmetsp:Transcript_3041/g.5337  ORF Transcript_3041/g.5337 Transcript_3041/m.5337 type:complete len:196 (+) Transcript_3041:68-655(+)